MTASTTQSCATMTTRCHGYVEARALERTDCQRLTELITCPSAMVCPDGLGGAFIWVGGEWPEDKPYWRRDGLSEAFCRAVGAQANRHGVEVVRIANLADALRYHP